MKVLYITGMYPNPTYPQKGIFCHEQVKALKKLGVEVDVVVPITVYEKEVKQKTWTYEGVGIRYVRFFKLPGTGDFHRTGKNLFFSLDRAVDLRKYDLYHADAPLPAGQAAIIASQKYGKPFVVHGHGLDVFLGESYKESKNCKKIIDASVEVYEKADAVCGVSQKVLDKIEKRVKLGDRGHVVYNGVDTDRFRPVPHINKKIKLISVGNLIALKGHDLTIKAVQELHEREYPVELEIVGRGPLENELKERASGCSYISFLGYVPYEEVNQRIANADIFVLPSWYEALGCVYLEAMACGIPPIGCLDNGIDEVIRNGVDGVLVQNKNVVELVRALTVLMDERERYSIGSAARKTVVKKYTWSHSASKLVEVYKEVAE